MRLPPANACIWPNQLRHIGIENILSTFNPLPRVLKENINKIYKMQHFTTLGNAAYKFFKTFRANPAWAKCVGRDRGVEYFHKDRQHTAHVHNLVPTEICEPYKHLTIAKAYIARQIAPWQKRHIWVWSVSDVLSRIQVWAALPC